jgi:hypothetical protein
MEITIRIKLINRFKPQGIPDYKKKRSMKLPVHLRRGTEDNLNPFVKTLKVIDPDRLGQQINEEITRINGCANFEIKRSPDFGDKFIGEIDTSEHDDWYFKCFIPVSSNKSKSERLPPP